MNLGKKITGGKYHKARKKKLRERRGEERKTVLGKTKRKKIRTLGGKIKTVLLSTDVANVSVDSNIRKVKIINVEETPQNRFLARENRLVKGAIIATEIGRAKITNRPTQEGMVNAVLVEKAEEKKKS